MEIFLFYLLRVTIAATILYLFFKFILSKRTFHAINRIVVLCMVVMTLVLPLFTIKLPEITFSQPKVETVTTQLTIEEALAYLNAASYTNTPAVTQTPATEIPWLKILGVIYLIGFTVALLRFAISFIRMSRIIRQTKKVRLDDKSLLCISDKKVSPFSWMKFIVLSKDDFTDDSKDIIRHEQAHVGFGHSYDLLFLDLYSLVFWFNPFAWLLRLELQNIHEYQADEKVLAEGANAKNYHLSLIRQCVGEYKFALANNFEYNNLHKRIKMTMKTKSSSRQKWLYGTIGLSVMLCIVVLSFNGLKAKAADLKEMIQSELLPTDSIKKSTPAVVRIRKVAAKNNATIATPIMVDTVAPDTKIRVRLSPNEDVRVVGYGNQSAKDVEKNGITTWNGLAPLIIVDGKEFPQGLGSVNISDVQTIQVLKDASATAIYGEKGKSGVILITTKEYAASHKNEMIIRKVEAKNTNTDYKNQTNKKVEVRVAGYGTLNGAKPLIIVDGVESSEDINPKDVDRVQVLKDASATKLYGDKGKNGVILVTTKKNIPKTTIDKSKIVIGGPNDAEWHENQPNVLVFVDGKEGSFNDFKAEDVESISVNKDFATIRDSMKVVKNAAMISKFKKPGISGVVSIKLKKK